jgi:hypothetical protein
VNHSHDATWGSVCLITNFLIIFPDWPDYTSDSDADSDISEVDAIVTTRADVAQDAMEMEQAISNDEDSGQQQWDIPVEDNTAQKIMHLLSEIGHSNIVEKVPFSERNFLPCACCTGKLQIV